MRCPKCGSAQDDGNDICDLCGIVFAKYHAYRNRPRAAAVTADGLFPRRAAAAGLGGLLLGAPAEMGRPALAGRALLHLALAVWGWRLMASTIESNAVGGSFLHLVNLPFHEAGHVFLSPFGDFMHSLGGTLGQLLMPLVCAVTLLWRTRDPFGASVALWWFGENFLDIAPYINDARALELPLLGGNVGHSTPYGFHDWNYLLTESGLLYKDHQLARASHLIGCVVMVAALAWGGAVLYRAYRRLSAANEARRSCA